MTPLELTTLEGLVRLAEAAAAVITLGVGLRAKTHAKTAAGEAVRAREQVENNHETNLRDDLDRLHDDLAGGLRSLGHQLGELRTDLTTVTRRHDHDIERLRDELAANRSRRRRG